MSLPLIVEHLKVTFPAFALKEVGFAVQGGTIVGFLGENGAGKTTTLKLIMGMLRKDGGTARIGPHDHVKDEKLFKQRIGFVEEEPHFYATMKVGELLDFAAPFFEAWDHRACEDLLRRFELRRDALSGKLSKGMRTKLALVIALAHRPDVLVLDEPSAGLDPRSRVELFDILRATRDEGRGVFFSTHNVDEIERVADRILVLHRGSIVADEALSDLRSRAGGDGSFHLERWFLDRVADG